MRKFMINQHMNVKQYLPQLFIDVTHSNVLKFTCTLYVWEDLIILITMDADFLQNKSMSNMQKHIIFIPFEQFITKVMSRNQ